MSLRDWRWSSRADALVRPRQIAVHAAPAGEGFVPALILLRLGAEAAAGRDDHRGAGRPRRIRKEGGERRDGDIARELPAILTVPGFGRGRAGHGPSAE